MTRRDKLIVERDSDPYQTAEKLPDPSACTECRAMYRAGRWTWGDPPADAKRVVCPACRRAKDGYPAGILTIEGEFLAGHRTEVIGLVRNVEERESKTHPLKRIIGVDDSAEGLTVTTADAGLARNIGDALHSAYEGELDYRYPGDGGVLRVHWVR